MKVEEERRVQLEKSKKAEEEAAEKERLRLE